MILTSMLPHLSSISIIHPLCKPYSTPPSITTTSLRTSSPRMPPLLALPPHFLRPTRRSFSASRNSRFASPRTLILGRRKSICSAVWCLGSLWFLSCLRIFCYFSCIFFIVHNIYYNIDGSG